jgi:hypothetical protein
MSNYRSFVDDLKAKVKGTDKNDTRMAVPHHDQPDKKILLVDNLDNLDNEIKSSAFDISQTKMKARHHGKPYKTPGELQTYMVVPHHGQPYNTQLRDINGKPI